MIKTILVLKVKKLDSFIISAIPTLIRFLDLDKFLDLNLSKFQLFNLAKISTNLFLIFFIYLFLLPPASSSLILFINTNKYFTNLLKIVLGIKITSLAILLNLYIKR